ncbi:MAG: DUF389 domain-containing protein [Betaproteobacteria bacterium]|nr:DUF389 domain-containing protein [Betaproteobacteria bacterium]
MIDETIRGGVAVGGTNLWVLFFAILIASIGLNVNSTAVIIGAMLISPLMGPIVGIGYGAGVKDAALIRLAARNLAIFVAISLATATVYFLLTPLRDAQSELLARTSPNLWDVLIAFFGGAVGMIGATRRYISNVVPGVAIATALMPPLCTAGYGLATGNMAYFGGAFYLFTINSVFIAFASLVVVKMVRLPARGALDGAARQRARLGIAVVVLATAVPSAFLAYDLVKQKVFEQHLQRAVQAIDRNANYLLLGRELDLAGRRVSLTLGGDAPVEQVIQEVRTELSVAGYSDVDVVVRKVGTEKFDVTQLKQELQQQVFSNTLEQLQGSQKQVQRLEKELASLQAGNEDHRRLLKEISAQYPEAVSLTVSQGSRMEARRPEALPVLVVTAVVNRPIAPRNRTRLLAWLKARYDGQDVELVITDGRTSAPNRR